jgi:hypothetical protein
MIFSAKVTGKFCLGTGIDFIGRGRMQWRII